jgi:hypothetical protein
MAWCVRCITTGWYRATTACFVVELASGRSPIFPSTSKQCSGCEMTEEEWVQQALSTLPPMSPTKKARLALLFRDEPSVAKVLRFETRTAATGKQGELHNLGDYHPAAV